MIGIGKALQSSHLASCVIKKRPLCIYQDRFHIFHKSNSNNDIHRTPSLFFSEYAPSKKTATTRTKAPKMNAGMIRKKQRKLNRDLTANSTRKMEKMEQLKQKIQVLSEAESSTVNKKKNKKIVVQSSSHYKKPVNMPLRGPYSIFISCLPGLEPLLLQEVQYLLLSNDENNKYNNMNMKIQQVDGGVKTIIPSLAHIYLLHLYLGTASHIYLRLNDDTLQNMPNLFKARGFTELKRKLKDLIVAQNWEELLNIPHAGRDNSTTRVEASDLDWQLQVHVSTSKSKLMHTKAVEERVREVIGEVLHINGLNDDNKLKGSEKEDNARTEKEKVVVANETNQQGDDHRPIVRLFVRIDRDEVQLSLDTSSSKSAIPLHMRGYRLDPYKAPLREDLAFALLLASGLKPRWNLYPLQPLLAKGADASAIDFDGVINNKTAQKNNNNEQLVQLFDPLCGSGTIAIEGASILAGLPPGRNRPSPLLGTKLYNHRLWNDVKSKALIPPTSSGLNSGKEDDDNTNKKVLVAANDINSSAIKAAKSNAERAGVSDYINFEVGHFANHPLLKSSYTKRSSSSSHSNNKQLRIVTNPPYGKRISSSDDGGSKSKSIYKQIARALRSSTFNKFKCTMIGKDPRSLRESSLPMDVAFSTKHGGLSVVAMRTTTSSGQREFENIVQTPEE